MSDVCNVDQSILADPANEEARSLDYFVNGAAFLANWLHNHDFTNTRVFVEVMALLDLFGQDRSGMESDRIIGAATDVCEFGTVGAALYRLGATENSQMRTELNRYATDADGGIGYFYLFYIAGWLAGKGWTVDFVPESRDPHEKRPDLRAEKGGRHIFIEANAKQPAVAADTPDRLW